MTKTSLIIYTLFILLSCSEHEIDADILIVNGAVYDGISDVPLLQDIAIQKDKIIFIGDSKDAHIKAKKIIDASGKIVSPGFIDPHTHADVDLVNEETSHNKPFLMQGITTVVVGNDGDSFYPSKKYRNLYQSQGIGTNVVMLIGHSTVRKQIMGQSDRMPTEQELGKMKALVQEEMDQGAFGMSTGLFYAPGSYSNTEEVVELASVVARNNGIYDTHLRDESSFSIGLVNAVKEAIEIGKKAEVPIHISHIKCLGKDVWGKSMEIIQLIEDTQKEGIQVTANQYPYDASATSLKAAVVPRWAESGGMDSLFIRLEVPDIKNHILKETKSNIERRGGASKLLIVKLPDSSFVGKNLEEISHELHLQPEEAVFEILKIGQAKVVSFNMTHEDINNFMKQDWVVTGSDGNTGHPRKYGSFPRKYAKYVKKDSIIDVTSFINGSTFKTAQILKIPDRGALKVGYYADIIIFDPDRFKDKADYTDAFQLSEGLDYSIINGQISVENGQFMEKKNGKVLFKNE